MRWQPLPHVPVSAHEKAKLPFGRVSHASVLMTHMLGQPQGPVGDGKIESLWLRAAESSMIYLVFKYP